MGLYGEILPNKEGSRYCCSGSIEQPMHCNTIAIAVPLPWQVR